MKGEFDVVVVGSGAGGGVVAGELAQRGRDVLLLECGPHRTAADFTRWEAKATHDLFWPLRLAPLPSGEMVAFLAGRCVGGTTTINTKVAMRAHERDVAKWHAATGLTNERNEPFASADLDPYFDRVERVLGVRERRDWTKSVRTVEAGFRALGTGLEPVLSYTDVNCMRCGSCLQGCSTNAGKSTMNTYIHDAWARGLLELRADSAVEHVLIEDSADGPQATGVEYVDAAGARHGVQARVVVVAAGALNTPQLLIRSGLGGTDGGSPAAASIGRHLGLHPVRLVYGLFDEPQDAHMVYPITAHCTDFQRDEEGGFVVEATTIQDPINFATTLCDERGPLWGPRLVEAARAFRRWVGLLALSTDDNNSAVVVDEDGGERFEVDFQPNELERIDRAFRFSREVLEASGARQVYWTGLASTHVQGSCRMGDDPTRSVVDRNGESHDVRRLFVGDGSLVPRTLSANPSVTIMALATRLAEHLDADPNGYLGSKPGVVSARA
jgi:choline dehydrogenase-like flavoprotein